jgi:glycerol transport system substrate-binding protein
VDLRKSHVGLTFVRDSTVRHESFTERAPKLGGLIEFYRSPDRYQWTDTGVNVPDYPRLAQLWWQNIGDVTAGTFTPQEAMDRLADEMDELMARMQAADEQADTYSGCGPRLNEPQDPEYWLSQPGAPWPQLDDEKPQGVTVDYDELITRWTEAQ